MILELKRQGLGVSAIARQTGLDRKTVRKYLERGLEVPVYGASRVDLFATLDRPNLQPLPPQSYASARWKRARVAPDYHIEVDSSR